MEIQNKLELLTGYIRSTRIKFIASVIIISLLVLSLFLLGTYYFLFQYYESLAQEYYGSLLTGVYLFQKILIKRDSYRDDLENIAVSLKTHRGVMEVWCTDRSGKLIFHTDSKIYDEFQSQRLPSGYYRSIHHLWDFQDGKPQINAVRLRNWLTLRYSIPLYAFGRDSHEFILGMDVKRFIFLPEKRKVVLIFSAGFIFVAFFFFFLPLFLWARGRFNDMITQTRRVVGGIQLEIAQGQPKTQNTEIPPVRTAAPEKNLGAYEETRLEESSVENIDGVMKEEEKQAQKDAIEEKMQMIPLLMLMETKQKFFRKHEIDLPFLQASVLVYHAKDPRGSYLHYTQESGYHMFGAFTYPGGEPEEASNQLTQITEIFESELKKNHQIKPVVEAMNLYCLENKFQLDLSILMINEREQKVEYSASGAEQTIYLKDEEEEIKNLKLDVPQLGSISESGFDDAFSYAEIGFVENDFLVIPAHNALAVEVENEKLLDLIKKVLLARGDSSAHQLAMEIHNIIEPVRKKDKNFPETGLIIFKFI
jgi:hypothetical protein